MSTARKTLGLAVLIMASGFTVSASALPIFTFTEYGGFTADVGMARYTDAVTGDSGLLPPAGPLYSVMSWTGNRKIQSALELDTVTTPTALMADTWTTISTLFHHNNVVQGTNSWFGQNIWGRVIISDADGGSNTVLDDASVITLNMTETRNNKTCASPNPLGTRCDDYFTITTPIDDLFFSANDGSQWTATFRFANLVNAAQIANVVYTGEDQTSSVDVQMLVTNIGGRMHRAAVSAVPEPATMVILVLGLLGIGIARHHIAPAFAQIPGKRTR